MQCQRQKCGFIRTSEAMPAPVEPFIRTRGTASRAFDFLDTSLLNLPFANGFVLVDLLQMRGEMQFSSKFAFQLS